MEEVMFAINKKNVETSFNEFELKRELHGLINAGLNLTKASKYLAKKTGHKKGRIYNLM